ncbi:endosome protein [Mycena leptocephala]|nr:endosome protein [Mycena leptocephala]
MDESPFLVPDDEQPSNSETPYSRGIMLRDSDGPVDMSREELIDGDGGFEGLESRWLESVSDHVRFVYSAFHRADVPNSDYQIQYLPNSLPTDITLSQFLSIQEKGPDYETVNSLIVHARTEITFLPDPASSLTNVAVGLATKPYPAFRLPGLNRYSVAYHSNGDKSHNYPFTASQFGPLLKRLEDAFVGLSRWNLFPTIGADGPCSVHVNLGQAGFVFIEANVKKWGLAPSVGTLAPPPAYGSERGSILLDVGGRVRARGDGTPHNTPSASSPVTRRGSHRTRRPKPPGGGQVSSPLRTSSFAEPPMTPPPPITPIFEEAPDASAPGPSTSRRYISPTDLPFHAPPNTNLPSDIQEADEDERTTAPSSPATSSRSLSPDAPAGARNPFTTPRRHRPSLTHMAASLSDSGSELTIQVHPPTESPMTPNPPTPNVLDIHLQALSSHRRTSSGGSHSSRDPDDRLPAETLTRRDPPAYSPLDAFTYQDGVHIDLPAEVIAAALEGNAMPTSAIGHGNSDRRRTRRH